MPNWYPNRSDLVGPDNLERTVKKIFDLIYSLKEVDPNAIAKAISPDLISKAIPIIKNALQAGSPNSLNLQGLQGAIQGSNAPTHQFATAISSNGSLSYTQPAAAGLSETHLKRALDLLL